MGTWGTTSTSFKSFFSDRVGYKTGLALDNDEIIQLLDKMIRYLISSPIIKMNCVESEQTTLKTLSRKFCIA